MPDEVQRYLDAVRHGLRGLPRADVDDTIEEMRAHLREEIGERGDTRGVIRDFGDAADVASAILARKVRLEEAHPVPQASLGRRYSAWATDVVIGLGPLLLVPTAIGFTSLAIGGSGDRAVTPIWIAASEHVAVRWLQGQGYAGLAIPAPIPAWQWVMAIVLVAWAVYYWLVLRRGTSSSVGMWMTGLRGLRVNDDRLVFRERDIAESPAPLGNGRARWWVLLPAIPTGCLCILLLIFYLWTCVGAFVPPRA